MLFNSFSFAVFLPIVFLLYWFAKNKYRNYILLLASYYFYMSWNPKLIFLILATTVVSFISARLIAKRKHVKLLLVTTLIVCLGILVFYKYFNFFSLSVTNFLQMISIPIDDFTLNLLLPVGISFYTFQTLSYVIDVYRGNLKAETNFFTYALYVSFFPQLVAGPIERPSDLLPQFKKEHIFDYCSAMLGMKNIAIGAFKKIFVADALAGYVDLVYNNVGEYKGLSLIIVSFLFAIQIYCDFSGYSQIALGTAQLLGFKLIENFKTPYFSKNIKEFWSRWHISLSSWFRDYVYIPLGGNRKGTKKHYINLMLTFILSGLWHGANWTFVIWGLYHGVLNSAQVMLEKHGVKVRVHTIFKVLLTFVLVNIGWVIFRANNITEAIYVFSNMFVGIENIPNYIWQMFVDLELTKNNLAYLILPIVCLFVVEFIEFFKGGIINFIDKQKIVIKYAAYIVISYATIITFFRLYLSGVEQAFIYFQF